MEPSKTTPKFPFYLEPFGQQPSLWNLYTQLTFCYAHPSTTTQEQVTETLRNGLKRLTAGFPWVAGQVTRSVDANNKRPDYYAIEGFEPLPKLIVKDLSKVLPSFDVYETSRFPISFLDENVVAPRKTKSVSDEVGPKPVFMVQATFIRGGLLLTFAAQHGTMDMVGMGEVIRLLSKACHDVPFTEEELKLGNRDRWTVVPLLDESEQRPMSKDTVPTDQIPAVSRVEPDEAEHIPQPSSTPSSQTTNQWASFVFSSSSLQALKSSAINSTTLTTNFISTDDTLSAFIWQHITQARAPRYSPTHTSTFARTVDMRHLLNIPPRYPGNLASKSFTTLTFHDLHAKPLGAIASLLRQSIDPTTSTLTYDTREAATMLAQQSPQTNPNRRAQDLSSDIAFSSWAKLSYCHDLNFNLGLGRPKAVRRPGFAVDGVPMEGVVYLMPKGRDGEVVVAVCLRSDDLRRLRADSEWDRVAEYVG